MRELVVEDFQQAIFQDPAQGGATLAYNLYIPKNYDPEKRYPLVLFMHDAGAVSSDIKTTLVQGLGAITFSSPEWQAEHPCFVLAPQYDTIIVNDLYQHGPELERTMHLVKALTQQYAIDTNRIYNTGQSMGGMTVMAMAAQRDNYFAALLPMSCKWGNNFNKEYPFNGTSYYSMPADGKLVWQKDSDGISSSMIRRRRPSAMPLSAASCRSRMRRASIRRCSRAMSAICRPGSTVTARRPATTGC